MSTPELPQPFYPGQNRPAVPPATPPPAPPPGPPTQGYAPRPGGGAPGGPGGPTGGSPKKMWLWIVVGCVAVIAIASGIFGIVRGLTSHSEPPAADPNTTSEPATTVEDPVSPPPADDPAAEFASAVDTGWNGRPVVQQCILDEVGDDTALRSAVVRVVVGGFSETDAMQVAQLNVDCMTPAEREQVVLASDVTPYCEYYDFSVLTDDDWVILMADLFSTIGGIYTSEEFGQFYFPDCVL